MAYEYEKENIRKLNSYNVPSGGGNITKPIDELHEVYRKAKAFDEILKIDTQATDEDRLSRHFEIAINDENMSDEDFDEISHALSEIEQHLVIVPSM